MKTTKIIIGLSIVLLAALSVHAQPFQNLNFESAMPGTPISGPLSPSLFYQPVGLALPSWAAYLGTVQQTEVLQNVYTSGTAEVDLFGPSYPTTGPFFGIGTIDGNYSVVLQAGNFPNSTTFVGTSIEQMGLIRPTAQSLEFTAWTTPFTEFSVSFDGNILTPVVLGSGPNYTTIYGVDISPYENDVGTLEFTALFSGTGASALGLDDITFSPNAVPEPSIVALSAIGGLLFGARKWLARG